MISLHVKSLLKNVSVEVAVTCSGVRMRGFHYTGFENWKLLSLTILCVVRKKDLHL